MANEINGTNVLIHKGAGAGSVIVGQTTASISIGGTPIDISSKTFGDWVTLMDTELAGRQITISGECIYQDDSVFQAMLNEAFDGTQDNYTITMTSGAATDESFTGKFVPSGVSYSANMGEAVKASFTLTSSGVVTRTAQA